MDRRLDELKDNLEAVVDGMSADELAWHLPSKWCAAEVLEHLYLTYTGTMKGFDKVLTNGQPLATKASIKHRVLTFIVVGLGYMPEGRESPATARPRGLPQEQVRKEFGPTLVAMDAVIGQCEARFGGEAKLLDHPILGPLSAEQWRTFHLVHGRHHLKQLLRLRKRASKANEVKASAG